MPIEQDVRSLTPGNLIDLYEIDLRPIGVQIIIYVAPYSDENGGDILFQGTMYQSFPIIAGGFDRSGKGPEKRPKVTISNYSGILSQYMATTSDMIGAKVIRKRTLTKYLGTMTKDESSYIREVYYIEQKITESAEMIEFELSSALDFLDKKLPGRVCIANSCPWSYKSSINGSGCTWHGTDPSKWFDRYGNPVASADLDVCGKRLSDCKLRFGEFNALDYGGFPALGRS